MSAMSEESTTAAGSSVTEEVESKESTLVFDSSSRTGLMYNDKCERHSCPDENDHPEQPGRIVNIRRQIIKQGMHTRLKGIFPGRPATEEELLLTHDKKHVHKILNLGGANNGQSSVAESSHTSELNSGWLDSDTFYNGFSSEAAALSAGGMIELCRQVCLDELDNGFSVMRPPGHHCEKDHAMGFCLFNSIAVAVNAIRNDSELKKSYQKFLIVDWDVHHGNGTQNLFEDDDDVLYFSIHRSDRGFFYPRTGIVSDFESSKTTVNVPLDTVRGHERKVHGSLEYLYIFQEILIPIAHDFQPDLILVSCGFDACIGDPLGGMEVCPPAYAEMTALLLQICPKLVICLEGGYNLTTMPSAALAMLDALCNADGSFNEREFESRLKDQDSYQKSWKPLRKKVDTLLWETRSQHKKFELGFVDPDWVADKVPGFLDSIRDMKEVFGEQYPSCALAKEKSADESEGASLSDIVEGLKEIKLSDQQICEGDTSAERTKI